jgi:hypothetical protein
MAIRERLVYAIDVVTDGSKRGIADFKKQVGEAEGAVGKLKAGWGSVMDSFKASPGTAIAAGAAIGAVAAKAVDDASNLTESVNAVNVAYGDAADGVHDLGEESAESFGLSQRAFNEFSVQFSAFADKVAKGSGRDVVDVLEEMTTRTADFASVNNLSMAEAAQIMQSSLAGETEALRRYGGDVSAAAVETFALENGLIKTKSELTESIKVQARYGLLMEETNKVAGDFANTSGGLANQQRILTAQYEDLSARLGKTLIPLVTDATQSLNEMAASAGDVADALRDIPGVPKGVEVWWEFLSPKAMLVDHPLRLAGAVTKLGKSLFGFGGDAEEAAQGSALYDAAVQGVTDTIVGHIKVEHERSAAVDEARAALKREGETTEVNTVLAEKNAEAVEEAAAAKDRLRRAAKLSADAIRDHTDAIIDGLGGLHDYADATRDLDQEVKNLRTVLEETPDDWAAVESAQRGARDQALQTAEAYASNAGAIDNTAAKAILMIGELERQKAVYPELVGVIQGYIDELNRIPAVKTTTVMLNSAGQAYTKQTIGAGGRLVAGAEGAIVTRPTGALIGEAGPEAVIPLNKMPGASPLPGGMGGGGRNYTINLYGGQATPEAVVDAIKKFERANGDSWRR